jgi:hypothetical protein
MKIKQTPAVQQTCRDQSSRKIANANHPADRRRILNGALYILAAFRSEDIESVGPINPRRFDMIAAQHRP